MDTDAIVKLTKAGAKEVISKAHEIVLAPAVQREAIDQGKAGGHGDALLIERNVKGRRMPQAEAILADLRLAPGEEDALRLYLTARADVVVSDDGSFLKKLRSLRIPRLTPASLLVEMVRDRSLTQAEGLRLLDQLAPMIAEDEYYIAKNVIGVN
jgi:hypothetical protein